ncbi:hypothetical protein G2248_00265 [Escherichia phage vB_EcoM_G2248]|nr:hypothetical protein G2248_00265 [Escherichia phage vB_EcoM_G2248]
MKNIIAAIVLSATAFGANAASFDCAKATTKSEKFICANESISALDSKLHEVYVKAVKIDPSLKQEQRNWNKTVRDTMINIGQIQPLEAVYNAQIQNLMNVLPKEETASESDSETSAKVEEEQPKQEAKVVEEPKVETFTYQCTVRYEWSMKDGISTKIKEAPLYAKYGNQPVDLKVTIKNGKMVDFVYIDEYNVHKANVQETVMTKGGFYKNVGKKDLYEYSVFEPNDGTIRFEKRHPTFGGAIDVDQYVCK